MELETGEMKVNEAWVGALLVAEVATMTAIGVVLVLRFVTAIVVAVRPRFAFGFKTTLLPTTARPAKADGGPVSAAATASASASAAGARAKGRSSGRARAKRTPPALPGSGGPVAALLR
jgi:hypothetical protein